MTITIADASNYFKGLLLLIRKDREVTQPEIDLMKRIGKALGFEKEFCDNAIREILENTYIEDKPPGFSTKELAIKFIIDGLTLAFVDHEEIHPHEEQWLKSTTEQNGVDLEFFSKERENAKNRRGYPVHLEVDDLTVEYS
jgi:hypothetical protein